MVKVNIFDLIVSAKVAENHPSIVQFMRDRNRTVTYGELRRQISRLSARLAETGFVHGGRVVIMAADSAEWIASALAVMHAGGIVVPLDIQMTGDELKHVLHDSDPVLVLTTAALQERITGLDAGLAPRIQLLDTFTANNDNPDIAEYPEMLPSAVRPGDVATIFYTSGTTGAPKGVPLTHWNLASNVRSLCTQNLADKTDRILVPLPFHHVYPFTVGILVSLTLGATIILPYSLVGPQIVRSLREGRVTVLLGVPRLYEEIWHALEQRINTYGRLTASVFHGLLQLSIAVRRYTHWRLGRYLFAGLRQKIAPDLRMTVSGGAALDPLLGRRLQGLGWEVTTGYGLTETSPILTFNPPDRVRFETAGMILPGVEIAIDARSGPGEVLARGPNVFAGYRNLPEKTAEAFDDTGWFRTGDIGELDRQGYLHLQGRRSAMIVLAGGENIDPERVERQLDKVDGIRETGVLEQAGRLVVVVVPEPSQLRYLHDKEQGLLIQRMVDEAARSLPGHHRPGRIRISQDPLPRTRLGKLRRHKLREFYDNLDTAGQVSSQLQQPVTRASMSVTDQQLLQDPTAGAVWDYLAERFHTIRLTPDSSLALDLGIDSLSWVELGLILRDRAAIDIDDTAIARIRSVRDLMREAVAATGITGFSEDFSVTLAQPEKLLNDELQAWMAERGYLHNLARVVLFALGRLLGRVLFKVEIHGQIPVTGQFLITPRHLSILDPLVLFQAFGREQLASLYWAGFTGYLFAGRFSRWFSRVTSVLPIDPAAAPRSSLALAVACLQRGHSLVWFPEGRRSPDGHLQELRPGIGLVLKVQPVAVIPVWIEGSREVLPPGRRLPRPGRIRMVIGEPLMPERFGSDEHVNVRVIQTELTALGAQLRD